MERNGCVSTKGIRIEHIHLKSINGRSEPDRLTMAHSFCFEGQATSGAMQTREIRKK